MPSVVATLKIKEGSTEDAKALLKELAAHAHANEPGTQAYAVHQRKDDPSVFIVYEKYESDEAFKTHGAHVASVGARFAAVLDGRPDIVLLDEI